MQLDLGLAWEGSQGSASVVLFADRVGDYILRDRARGQDGVRLADGASIYRNVDASLRGVEVEARWQWTPALVIEAEAAWVRGENRSDDRPLAQIDMRVPDRVAIRVHPVLAGGLRPLLGGA